MMALRQVGKCSSCQRYLSPTRLVSTSPTLRRSSPLTHTYVVTSPKHAPRLNTVPLSTWNRTASNTSSQQEENEILHSKDDCDGVPEQYSDKRLELQDLRKSVKKWAYAQQSKIDIASFAKLIASLNIELPKNYKRLLPTSMRINDSGSKIKTGIQEVMKSKEELEQEKLERKNMRDKLYLAGENDREQHNFSDAMKFTSEATEGVRTYYGMVDVKTQRAKTTDDIPAETEHDKLIRSESSLSLPALTTPQEITKPSTVGGIWERLPNFSNLIRSNQPTKQEDKKKLEKKKKDLLKRPLVAKAAVDRRTRALVINVKQATSPVSQMLRLEELCKHLSQYPEAKSLAVKEKVLMTLLRLRETSDTALAEQAREALALIGHADPPKGHGIRILAIDGGGTRGLMAIDMMKKMEEMANRKIHEMFDFICGVSTGALIAVLISVYKVPLDECERIYKQFSQQMFNRYRLMGTSKLVLSHAYYDSKLWEDILKQNLGETTFLEATRDPGSGKVAAVSSIVNQATMQSFIFCNYTFPPGVHSHYPGSMHHHVWEAVRASSAAPGYFEEYKLGDYIHQDGGLLTNNPTAIAIHEAKLLWPRERIQCVVSMGTGKHRSTEGPVPTYTLKDKINKIVQSATDTEAVHTILSDLLPPTSYYRINPYLSENFDLDEIRPEKWEQMRQDVNMYMRKNESKFATVTQKLSEPRRKHQLAMDWLQHQAHLLL